jgi:hypothetical protein
MTIAKAIGSALLPNDIIVEERKTLRKSFIEKIAPGAKSFFRDCIAKPTYAVGFALREVRT